MIVYDARHKPVELGDSVGHGGEATVYRVNGQHHQLAKVYEPEPRPNYAGKLDWMVSHPPENPTSKIEHASLAWPDGLLFDSRRRLVGYSMPYIQRAVPLLEVFNPRRRAEILPQFDRRYLLRTAHNLAAALGALHRSGYVAGDLNESNVLVTPTALVTLIDTDSFQVREDRDGSQIVHPCPVGKPEYTPPELQGKSLSEVIRLPDHDAFGLSVLLFQLLMEGSHPFRAQWLAAGDPPPLEVRIANGAYPYVESPAYPVKPPKNTLSIETLHPWLAELFRRSFVDGHLDPRWRPGPELWARALSEAEQAMVCCAEGHYYSSHLKECPYCPLMVKRPVSNRAGSARGRGGWSPPPYNQPRQAPVGQAAAAAAQAGSRAGAYPRTANPFTGWFRFVGAGGFAPAGGSASGGAAVFSTPAPSARGGVLRSRPLIPQGAVGRWIRQRTTKSLMIGGAQGALVGAIPGMFLGLYNWFGGEILAWSIMMLVGGILGGLLRGWSPGRKLAGLIDRYIGWKNFWEGVGLMAGLVLGGMVGLIFIWAIFPVIIGLLLGAQVGRYLGRSIFQVGSLFGWERIWGGFSALGFGALGFGMAKLLAALGVQAFGTNLANGLLPFAANGSLMWAGIWMIAGATGGALSGGLAGTVSDLIGRLSGLVD